MTILLLFAAHLFANVHCQETPASITEQQLEDLADASQNETEDDSYLQQLEQYRKNPLNLNYADENDLRELKILSGLQVDNFISYRKFLGKIISVYELQAIPSWDIQTIRKLLPLITINTITNVPDIFKTRIRSGGHDFIFRFSQTLEKSAGYFETPQGTKYPGSRQRLFFRYRYRYKNLFQYGITGDKDAGEQFFKGAQKRGFDFYSFHLFARKIGSVSLLALGDFTVNMGQGLIQWQSLAFRKGPDALNIKRQSPVIRPYNSAGEFNFHRGAAVTIQKGKLETTAFVSYRKLDANFVTDPVSGEGYITSFLNSGYHRTESEIADKNKISQLAFGGNARYRENRWMLGFNAIQFNFSRAIHKRGEPYNLYALSGNSWSNYSIDYACTYRNFHFYGEAAVDKNFSRALLNGVLISVDPRVDISFLHRSIDERYQSVNGNAFTESTFPTNEKGFFSGVTIRPAAGWRIDAYIDIYKFPWLKYLIDAPAHGSDYLAQVTYTPNKQLELYTRFRCESKQGNQPAISDATSYLVLSPRQHWRTHISYRVNQAVSVRSRVDLLWYDKKGANKENGFLGYFDFLYKPALKPYRGNFRLQYFETDDYNSRLYAYENDVLYYYSIPAFFHKGLRYYLNIGYDINATIAFWVKWCQTIYRDVKSIGSGLDEITGSEKSEIRFMAMVNF